MVPVNRKRRWRRLCVILAAGVLVGSLYGARAQLLPSVARFLDVSSAPSAVDYVMVLGGGTDIRPFVAATLVKAGLARQVLVPTSRHSPEALEGTSLTEEETVRRVLLARAVPAESIIQLDGECLTTFDEAQALARFLAARPGISVAVVTTDYHTRRASWVFRRVLGERIPGVSFVAAPSDGFDATNWWRIEGGFRAYLTEYVKLIDYWLRY
jgi:uncharacterized SAM-binding protein YcdF (DUF218 family)